MYINGRVKILTKKVTIILHIIEVNLAIPKTMTVAHSSLIVLSFSNHHKRQFKDIPASWRVI